ncbi:MAG: hypothetical protein ACE361_06905 [Aureliella sp.]
MIRKTTIERTAIMARRHHSDLDRAMKATSPNRISVRRARGARPCYRGSSNRRGLILLVVLGMLALFSLLAVTYVVFSSQSRSTSIALARAEIRGHKSHKGLMEEAVKALIREPRVATPISGHSLLSDLYGSAESLTPVIHSTRNLNAGGGFMSASDIDRPLIFGGHFMRIPLAEFFPTTTNRTGLPIQSDVWNGRVVTFLEGGGALSGHSFHIVRYIGRADPTNYGNPVPADILAQQYSITIDLDEIDLEQSYSTTIGNVAATASLRDWILGNIPGVTAAPGFAACYAYPGATPQPVNIMINAAPLNTYGVGVLADGSSQSSIVPSPNNLEPYVVATGLQPNQIALDDIPTPPATRPVSPRLLDALTRAGVSAPQLTRASQTLQLYALGSGGVVGDSDEPWDAPDAQNMALAFQEQNAQHPFQVIPSFHRAALINYLVNWSNPATPGQPRDPRTWTEAEFLLTLYRIELATLRPLSYSLLLPSSPNVNGVRTRTELNPEFTGSNPGSAFSTPTLRLDIPNNWASNWPAQWPVFEQWLNSLTLGPWDVDNNGDGLTDSLFVDAGLPLETSPEGKLLKAMVAYYVDDLDSKLDINATGSSVQADEPSAYVAGTQYTTPLSDAKFAENGRLNFIPQGQGIGPAEISFRHLLSSDAAYQGIIAARGGSSVGGVGFPGIGSPASGASAPFTAFLNPNGDDAVSLLNARGNERLVFASQSSWPNLTGLPPQRIVAQSFRHGTLPGLPLSLSGRASIELDRLGNPIVYTPSLLLGNNNDAPGSWNDPYEGPYSDQRFTLAEWERLYRVHDSGRSLLPQRLQSLFGLSDSQLATSAIGRYITPISSHLRVPFLGSRSRAANEPYFFPNGTSIRSLPTPLTGVQLPDNSVTPPVGVSNEKLHHYDGRSVGANSFTMLVNTLYRLKFANSKQLGTIDIAATNTQVESIPEGDMRNLFPMEFSLGHAFDINRPFGNRIDSDNDGNTDESDEVLKNNNTNLFSQELTTEQSAVAQTTTAVSSIPDANINNAVPESYLEGARQLHLNQDTNRANNTITLPQRRAGLGFERAGLTVLPAYWGLETRQLFARHLYCLAQLIIPEDYAFPSINTEYFLDLLERRELENNFGDAHQEYTRLRGRILAQWAANVVDFRDADSEMTRFPYDPDPFRDRSGSLNNTWDVAAYDDMGNVSGSNVVWGLEQPELLMTESLAFHDLRVREVPGSMPPQYEQFRIPQGSLFLEFFCPRMTGPDQNTASAWELPGVSRSLYRPTTNGMALDLGKVAPGGLPVWRVVIGEPIDRNNASQTLPTPFSRLVNSADETLANPPPATDVNGPQLHELTFQFGTNPDSGLVFDLHTQRNPTEALQPPQQDRTRIITFAADGTFSQNLMPNVANTDSQVFSNRNSNNSATNQLALGGGQYLVVGPRMNTFFGSRTTAHTSDNNDPGNQPNPHAISFQRINNPPARPPAPIQSAWAEMHVDDGAGARRPILRRPGTMRECVTMVAAVDSEVAWGPLPNPSWPINPLVGISVSEPLPGTGYYPIADQQVNSNNITADVNFTEAAGFANLYADSYWDYSMGANPNRQPPLDDGNSASAPLSGWQLGPTMTVGVPQPGTQLDWTTAYLQRLACPDKPYHEAFNPYITVDWMPIDLTVFNGEDDLADLDPPNAGDAGELRLASRQKTGTLMDPGSHQYAITDGNTFAGESGSTFLSSLTDVPQPSQETTSTASYFRHQIRVDDATATPPVRRPTFPNVNGGAMQNAFATLGYLNSAFALSGEQTEGGSTFSVGDAMYLGSPVSPTGDQHWRPESLFFANRDFANTLELMMVPTSAPGQINQEFTAENPETDESAYAPTYTQAGDVNRPSTPVSPGMPPTTGQVNANAITPFGHLLNFFQEGPELRDRNLNAEAASNNDLRHSKGLPLLALLDMLETPSPWQDSYRYSSPNSVSFAGLGSAEAAARSIILAPLRAPYNKIPTYREPGRVNLNMVAEQTVLHGLGANVFQQEFDAMGTNSATAWQLFNQSRRGYNLPIGLKAAIHSTNNGGNPIGYNPNFFIQQINANYTANGGSLFFNPHVPTRFLNPFKPSMAAGMVARTRNPFESGSGEQEDLHKIGERSGVLDLYSQKSAAHSTLLRGTPDTPFANGPNGVGVLRPNSQPLYRQVRSQRNAFNDFYPISRLKNLTTERSNAFAVYMTMAFFEYDPATGSLGVEYGADSGQAERYRAFYVIDRSRPVGYQVGEDHNVEKTILLRRYLNTDD